MNIIPLTNNKFKINCNGEVYSCKNNKLIKQKINKYGYNLISLRIDTNIDKTFTIHKLVYELFNRKLKNNEIVIHKDKNINNNNINNLDAKLRSQIKYISEPFKNDNEKWVYIKNFNNKYMISNKGNVYSLFKKQNMFSNSHNSGYKVVKLTNDKVRKSFLIHRLVVENFIREINSNEVVDHIDRDKGNNNLTNLRIVSISTNCLNVDKNMSNKNVILYKNNEYINTFKNVNTAIEVLNIPIKSLSSIYSCLNNKYKTAFGYFWKYKDENKHFNPKDFKKMDNIKNFDLLKDYKIDNQGNIIKKNKLLKPHIVGGYYSINLKDKNNVKKVFRINRLVAMNFIPNPDNLDIVHHKDGNKLNNNYLNLEWTTHTQNITYSCGKKVNQIDIVTGKIIKTYNSINEVYKSLNIQYGSHIRLVCNKKRKTAFGYKWEWYRNF